MAKYLKVTREDHDVRKFFFEHKELTIDDLLKKAKERFNFCPYEIIDEKDLEEILKIEKSLKSRLNDYYLIDDKTNKVSKYYK